MAMIILVIVIIRLLIHQGPSLDAGRPDQLGSSSLCCFVGCQQPNIPLNDHHCHPPTAALTATVPVVPYPTTLPFSLPPSERLIKARRPDPPEALQPAARRPSPALLHPQSIST